MFTETNAKSDEAIIRQMIDDWSRALEAGDSEALTVNYTEDSVLFDACPPYKTVGKEGIKQVWEQCLPYFPEKFVSEHRDLQVEVSGDLAFVYGLHHFIPDPPDHPCGQNWLRITVCFRRIDGVWKVLHEHVSTPFNPMNNEIWPIADPAKLDMPDYAAMGDLPPLPENAEIVDIDRTSGNS